MYIKCSCRKYLIRPVYPWSKLAKIPASTRQRGQAKLERLTRKGGTSCNSTHGIKATTGEAPEIDMLSHFSSQLATCISPRPACQGCRVQRILLLFSTSSPFNQEAMINYITSFSMTSPAIIASNQEVSCNKLHYIIFMTSSSSNQRASYRSCQVGMLVERFT